MRRGRLAIVLVGILGGGASLLAACVDLFHSTDFTTLCALDSAACAAPETGADAPDSEPPPVIIDFCTWTPEQAQNAAERTCAWVGACAGALPRSSFAACMLRARAAYDCALNPSLRPRGRTAELWSCLARIQSCTDVSRCFFGPSPPSCEPVAPNTSFTQCAPDPSSSTVVECALSGSDSDSGTNPTTAIESCVLEGRSCVALDTSRAICAGKGGIGCSGASRCDGTHAIACNGANDDGFDCAAFGDGRCVEDLDGGGVACAPVTDAAPCDGGAELRCDDAGIPRACVGGLEVAVDCAQLGQTCVLGDSGRPALDPLAACGYADAAAECSTDDECAGDILRSCAQRTAFEVSCAKHGLGPCTKPPVGRAPFATCKPPPP
jgi:hypothetical protein